LNGTGDHRSSPLHIVIFSASIVSDWQNPAATTVRAVMRALIAEGHEVVHLEERRNQPTVDLLRARGSVGLRDFTERYAELPYRTYEMPSGLERTVWFVRQVSTADAVIILDGTPHGVVELAAQLPSRHLTWVRWSSDPDRDTSWASISLVPMAGDAEPPEDTDGQSSRTTFLGPAVERLTPTSETERSGILLVAYDDVEIAEATRQVLADRHLTCLSAGSVSGDRWQPVSEVALPDHYQGALLTVIVESSANEFAAARTCLPIASGCQTITIRSRSDLDDLKDRIAGHNTVVPDAPTDLPDRFNATVAARRLIQLIRPDRVSVVVDTAPIGRG